MIPGIFTLQMLSWRHRLQDVVHKLDTGSGRNSLNYKLLLSLETAQNKPRTQTVSVQTKITNPHGKELLEFQNQEFTLQWVLST